MFTESQKFIMFYPLNRDGSVKFSTTKIVYKDLGWQWIDGKQYIKAKFIRYHNDEHEMYHTELGSNLEIFYVDIHNSKLFDSNFIALAKTSLVFRLTQN